MPLTFDTSKIDPAVTTVTRDDGQDYWSDETTCVVFATMYLGQNTITQANYLKFYERFVAHGLASGYGNDDEYITLDLVRKHIGLSTNASNYTDAAFNKRLVEITWKTAQQKAARELAALDLKPVNDATR